MLKLSLAAKNTHNSGNIKSTKVTGISCIFICRLGYNLLKKKSEIYCLYKVHQLLKFSVRNKEKFPLPLRPVALTST